MFEAKLVQDYLEAVDYANTGDSATDLAVGAVVVAGSLVGIAQRPIPVGATGSLWTTGVWDVALAASTAVTLGAKIYWDATNKKATTTSTSNAYLGVAVAAAASGDATVRVAINL